jgi:hypothetical protein
LATAGNELAQGTDSAPPRGLALVRAGLLSLRWVVRRDLSDLERAHLGTAGNSAARQTAIPIRSEVLAVIASRASRTQPPRNLERRFGKGLAGGLRAMRPQSINIGLKLVSRARLNRERTLRGAELLERLLLVPGRIAVHAFLRGEDSGSYHRKSLRPSVSS